MQIPYIHTSSREFVRQAVGFDNQEGVMYQNIGGEHALWAIWMLSLLDLYCKQR